MSNKCVVCDKTVYPMEVQPGVKFSLHKSCFRCATCKRTLTVSAHVVHGKTLLCQKDSQSLSQEAQEGLLNKDKLQEQRKREIEEETLRKLKEQEEAEQRRIARDKRVAEEKERRLKELISKLTDEDEEIVEEKVNLFQNDEKNGWDLSPTRFIATISLTKPIYSTGETIDVTSHLFNVHSLLPFNFSFITYQTTPTFSILNSDRAVVAQFTGRWENYSIVGFQSLYTIPAGDYRLLMEIPFQQKKFLEFGRAEREFSIQSHSSPPRFRKELEFVKKGYAAGDEVSAKLNVTRAEGGVPSDAKVIASVQISGNEISSHSLTLEEDGSSLLTFSLPDQLPDDVSALLHISVDDGSITESISKTIPILQNNLIVKFYPEGGNLIAGLENVVYVECSTKSEEPADIEAVIIEFNPISKSEYPVSRFATIHEGRAKFSFNPKVNFTYRCDVIKPANVGSLSLPDILSSGVVLHSPHNIFEEEIGVWVGSTNACKLLVQLFKKEVLISQETISFTEKDILEPSVINSEERPKVSEFYGTKSRKVVQQQEKLSQFGGGSQDISFYEEEDFPSSSSAPINDYDEDEDENDDKDENEALSKPGFKYVSLPLIESTTLAYNDSGVFRVLVTDKDLHLPYSERLVYRKIKEVLNVEVVTDKAQYSTSDYPVVAVKVTRSSDGSAVGGARMDVVVVDDSSLQMQEKRLQHPTIAPMVYLENEVKELKDTELYLPEYSSKANREAVEENLDLLLGIQGWRRFIFSFKTKNDCKEWFEKYPANSSSLLAISFLQQQAVIEPQYNMPPPPMQFRGRPSAPGGRGGAPSTRGGRGGAPPPPVNGGYFIYDSMLECEEKNEPRMMKKSRKECKSSRPLASFSFQESIKCEAMVPLSPPVPGGISISRSFAKQSSISPRGRIPIYQSHSIAADTLSKSLITTDHRGVAVINCSQPSTSSQYRILLNSFHPFLPLFGSSSNHFVSVKEDFYLQMNLPKVFTRKDQILLPIGVVNNSENDIEKVDLQIENLKFYYSNVNEQFKFNHEHFPLSSNTRVRKYVPFQIIHPFKQILSINAKTDLRNLDNNDFVSHSIERPFNVVDSRFLMKIENSGVVEKRIKIDFEVPEDISGEEQSILYSKLSVLLPTSKYSYKFDQLISRPAGCVEQITSTLYIVALSYQYLSKQPLTPSIFKSLQKATEYLNEGYTKLTQMECKNGGFDWWGSTTPHLGLSAYAIFVLKEMAKCIPNVQSSFIQRSVDWILSQRTEGLGRLMFNNDRYSYLYGQASKETIEAFVLFALTSSGVSSDLIKPELDFLFRYNGTDTYIWCLIAMIQNNIDKKEEAIATAKIVASKLNQKEGYVAGGSTSITSSFGINLVLETTAFAVWGWVEIDKEFFAKEIKSASEYLIRHEQRASTQASALIMKINSLLDTTEVIRHPYEPFAIIHNNKPVVVIENEKDYFNAFAESDRFTFDFAEILHVGRHSIEIHNVFGSSAQYSFITHYTTTVPQTHPETPLSLKLFLINGDNNEEDYNNNDQQQQIKVGENVAIKVVIKNNSENVMGMVTTEIGLPAGLLPNYAQLRQFVKAKKIHFYEIRENILVVYWRSFSANEEKSFILNFSSILPGDFLSVASCVYPYYATEYIYWHTPLKISIQTSD